MFRTEASEKVRHAASGLQKLLKLPDQHSAWSRSDFRPDVPCTERSLAATYFLRPGGLLWPTTRQLPWKCDGPFSGRSHRSHVRAEVGASDRSWPQPVRRRTADMVGRCWSVSGSSRPVWAIQ